MLQPTEACSFIITTHCMNQNIPRLKSEIESFNQRPRVSTPGEKAHRI